jgi:hypothetical protein
VKGGMYQKSFGTLALNLTIWNQSIFSYTVFKSSTIYACLSHLVSGCNYACISRLPERTIFETLTVINEKAQTISRDVTNLPITSDVLIAYGRLSLLSTSWSSLISGDSRTSSGWSASFKASVLQRLSDAQPPGCLCLFFLPDFWKIKHDHSLLLKRDVRTFNDLATRKARVLGC